VTPIAGVPKKRLRLWLICSGILIVLIFVSPLFDLIALVLESAWFVVSFQNLSVAHIRFIRISPCWSMLLKAIALLLLFTKSLDVRFAVRKEEFLAALLPRRFEFGRCDVPVRPAFLGNST
jgi:hypothetical protein